MHVNKGSENNDVHLNRVFRSIGSGKYFTLTVCWFSKHRKQNRATRRNARWHYWPRTACIYAYCCFSYTAKTSQTSFSFDLSQCGHVYRTATHASDVYSLASNAGMSAHSAAPTKLFSCTQTYRKKTPRSMFAVGNSFLSLYWRRSCACAFVNCVCMK